MAPFIQTSFAARAQPEITPALRRVRDAFRAEPEQFDIRFVGGFVRDEIMGHEHKDIDLCTDANPEQMIAIFAKHGIPYHETGLQHGTLTIVPERGEVYEITALRGETDHDGRHATVYYHRDWEADQARRDLTINSMMMDFDGNIFDPFQGENDIHNRVVRFVGSPDDRMREDYLRILRWVRFQGRFGNINRIDGGTASAAIRQGPGLKNISKERVWSEMSRIVAGSNAHDMLKLVCRLRLNVPIGLPVGSWDEVKNLNWSTMNPVTRMVAYLRDPTVVRRIAQEWRWSGQEARLGAFLAHHLPDDEIDLHRLVAHDGVDIDWTIELAHLQGRQEDATDLSRWTVPRFPVRGEDLVQSGMKPGPEVGIRLKRLKLDWAESNYTLSYDELMALPSI